MPDRAEGAGKTLEAAQQDALQQLGVPADQVEFVVLERSGALAGLLGRTQFRVRATRIGATDAGAVRRDDHREEPTRDMGATEDRSGSTLHEELAEAGRELLQQMVDLMGIDGQVVIASADEEEVVLNVEGDDGGLLIGRHGATLDAVQLIVAIGANRKVPHGARVIVDAEGYRDRHRQMVEERALKLAEEAVASGNEVVVPDLKPYERRLMHLALKDNPTVETYSEGEGDDRVLVISPKD
mgnify:CR=1 FL=1